MAMVPVAANAAAPLPPALGPGPALSRPDLAAVKALMFPCLAGLWVGGACAAAAAMILMVHPSAYDPIFLLILASCGSLLLDALLSIVVFVLLLRSALRDSDSILQACGPALRSLLRETTWIQRFAAQILGMISVSGCFVAMQLYTGSRAARIAALIIEGGAVIFASISCFDILPVTALMLWRTKPGGAAALGCVV